MNSILLKTIACSFLLACTLVLSAQSDKIKQMESNLRDLSGPGRVQLLLSLSDAYLKEGRPEKAEAYAEDAGNFARKIKEPELRAIALNKEGKIMLQTGKKKAGSKFEESLDLLVKTGASNNALALDNLEQLLSLAQKAGREKEVLTINAKIASLRSGGNIADTKSINSDQAVQQQLNVIQQQLAENQSEFKKSQLKLLAESQSLQAELAARQAEIDRMTEEQMKTAMLVMQQRVLLDSVFYKAGLDSLSVANANLALREAESNRKFNYAIMGVLLLVAGGSLFSFMKARQNAKILEEKNKTIREEQERSENLLLNILPSLVANELKLNGKTKAQYYDDVSVLFADFVGFSKIAEVLSPQQLVTELDTCFQKFDEIIAKHGLEKIKTIGDAYMCAGGLPEGGGAKMKSMVAAAFEMQQWLETWNKERAQTGKPRFDARIGIHRGPVVAGVVGSKKFAFDIWGDTVNVAARIEQAGEGGRINISGEAYAAIKDEVATTYRGKIPAKNKGEIDMYFLEN
ncbi:MAG: adenylate/guanylate cyclase domain-containing protein [Saprospiraceae bacterium]|nr:adenylate/guanylate cyclase domain-containing protein [Saprospiraceae bacterium]